MICFKRYGHLVSPVVGIIVSCYAFGSNGHMGECLMRAVITHRFSTFIALLQWLADLLSVTFLFIWKPCCLSFPNSKDICCLPHQHDNLFTVCQSLVGLDTILYTLSIFFVFLQIQRALTPFHQENVIVQLFLHTGGLCQNTMHDGSKTSKRSDALQQGPLERYVVRQPY